MVVNSSNEKSPLVCTTGAGQGVNGGVYDSLNEEYADRSNVRNVKVTSCYGMLQQLFVVFTILLVLITIITVVVIACNTQTSSENLVNSNHLVFLQSMWYWPLVRHHHHHHVIIRRHRDSNDNDNDDNHVCRDGTDDLPCDDEDDNHHRYDQRRRFRLEGMPRRRVTTTSTSRQQVRTDLAGFPSYWNYASNGQDEPIVVSYDNRSILLNGDRALFIGGSMHPSRATPDGWENALDYAVINGLNLLTIYIMWEDHQPTRNSSIDWNFSPSTSRPDLDADDDDIAFTKKEREWSIASAIRSASFRGFFVHVRLGPYVCAEYNYGGIPEWVPLSDPNMSMRRYNEPWMNAMEGFVTKAVTYLKEERLFAYQGGPIIMAQIENELGDDYNDDITISENLVALRARNVGIDKTDDNEVNHRIQAQAYIFNATEEKSSRRIEKKLYSKRTVQDYADWCGELAYQLAPDVVWTMCFGLSAKNTINTYNGQFHDTSWLDRYGDSGRIQIDHPAMWTEHEGGFQIWGEDANHPSDYFWGETARSMAYCTLRWFARGGSHMNYYMWWGGYNRKRSAAAGIMNKYASDAPFCPSGEPRQPKFGHFTDLATVLASVAAVVLNDNSALDRGIPLQIQDKNGTWVVGQDQVVFVYQDTSDEGTTTGRFREVLFVENASKYPNLVKVPVFGNQTTLTLSMPPFSAMIVDDGSIVLNSSFVNPVHFAFDRKIVSNIMPLRDWRSKSEQIGACSDDHLTQVSTVPIEQTKLNVAANCSSDYAWFETDFEVSTNMNDATLLIETQYSTALLVYLDGEYAGEVETHFHQEGDVSLRLDIGYVRSGFHVISFLSESLGYSNLVGRWTASSTKPKTKGITGKVELISSSGLKITLTNGRRLWRSYPSLHNQASMFDGEVALDKHQIGQYTNNSNNIPSWTIANFDTPDYQSTKESLYLYLALGRGHFWLNGYDLGRYWNITRGGTKEYSQTYYYLPYEYLHVNGIQNTLIFFDVFGSDIESSAKLVVSYVEPNSTSRLEDEVDYLGACL